MIFRSRSAGFAGLALALAVPLAAAYAAPAFADGDDAVVSAAITDGNVHVESTKGLSRVTVVLCDGTTVVADHWTKDQLTGDVEVDGVVQAVFVHSGANTTPEAQALLAELAGADTVDGESTGAIASYDEHACDEPGDGDGGNGNGNGDNGNGDNGNGDNGNGNGNGNGDPIGDPAAISDPLPIIPVVIPATVVPTPDPVVLPATVQQTPAPALAPTTAVLGETLQNGAELPRTGSAHLTSMLALALALITAGTALLAGFRRRVGSAVSPG